jgi:ABC-type glycerol-3-phosphate transport system permease component
VLGGGFVRLVVAIVASVASLIAAAMAAASLARMRTLGNDRVTRQLRYRQAAALVMSLVVPIIAYFAVRGWSDTAALVIVAGCLLAIGLFMLGGRDVEEDETQ